MMFYQVMLLVGYLIAAIAIRHSRSPQGLGVLLLSGLVVGLLILPYRSDHLGLAPDINSPISWLVWWLSTNVGLTFVALSLTAPLAQRIYSLINPANQQDPYFLYSASNLGSLLALLAYPLVVEPNLRISQQSLAIYYGYWILLSLVVLLVVTVLRQVKTTAQRSTTKALPIDRRQALRWGIAAFVPSTLMLSVTNHITTNIAPVPLLWVLPLSLYLLTFVIAFARGTEWIYPIISRVFPIALLALLALSQFAVDLSPWELIVAELLLFFIIALTIHLDLVANRPAPAGLGAFYFILALGGALGGVLNSIVAPQLFSDLYEFPLCLVLAALFVAPRGSVKQRFKISIFAVLLLFYVAILTLIPKEFFNSPMNSVLLFFGVPVLLIFPLRRTPKSFFIGLATVTGVTIIISSQLNPDLIESKRNFFGVKRVEFSNNRTILTMVVGGVAHGAQFTDPARRKIPLTYYHPLGPAGDIFNLFKRKMSSAKIGVIGLGVGSMACYSREDDAVTFFEIDPQVVELATSRGLFTFLRDCGESASIVVGDGRLKLYEVSDQSFDLLVLDAFSGDAVPSHLLTKEAVRLYLEKTTANGVVLFHLSNRFLDLVPNVAQISRELGLQAMIRSDLGDANGGGDGPRLAATYVAVTRNQEIAAELMTIQGWEEVQQTELIRAWSDDYNDLLSAIKF